MSLYVCIVKRDQPRDVTKKKEIKMRNQEKIVAVFQTWANGGIQMSNMVLASRDGQEAVNDFIEQHYNSGTFATLRTFTSEDEAWEVYELLNNEY